MRSAATVLAVAILVLGGTAFAQPVPDESSRVTMKYSADDVGHPAVRLSGTCPVAVVAVSDQRPNKETVGYDFKALLSGDPVPWVGDALRNLKAHGFAVQDPAPGVIGIRATLTRSYVWTASLRINSMVALDVEYQRPNGAPVAAKYRAFGSKTNMWGATDEFMTTLNYAMNNLLLKVAADLQKACSGA
jgi:hypothetical protein